MTAPSLRTLFFLACSSLSALAATFTANHSALPFCPERPSVPLSFAVTNSTNAVQTITAGTVWSWNFTLSALSVTSNLPQGATATVENGSVQVSFANDVVVPVNGSLSFTVQVSTNFATPGPVTLTFTGTPQGSLFLSTGQAIVVGYVDPQSCQNSPASAFTVDELLSTCPTAAEIAAINADLQISFEGDPTAGTQACTPEGGSAPLTKLRERAYQAIRLMQRVPFDAPLPWTTLQLYDWFKGAIQGVRFRNDIAANSCCAPANTINIQTQSLAALQSDGPEFVAALMAEMAHEARHNEGFAHTCSANDETLQELGAWGVQFHLQEYLAYRSGNFFLPKAGKDAAYYRQIFAPAAMALLNTRFCNRLPGLVFSPSTMNFGTLPVGTTSATRRSVATYTAGLPNPFTATSISGPNASDFTLVYESCAGVTIPRSCAADVVFRPSASGVRTASLTFRLGSASLNVALSGTGGTPPAGCTYALSATQQQFAGSGGTGTVRVSSPAGCAWTAESRAAFATLGPGSSGNGDGVVTYNVSANGAAGGRQGVLTIAGRTLTVTQFGTGAPFINSGGVVSNPSYRPGFAAQTWVSVFGADLSPVTRIWAGDDFVQGKLPVALDGVSAKVNNKPAYIYYVSPGLINLLAPDDAAVGEVQVEVTTPRGRSNFQLGRKARVAPDFFTFDNVFLAATHLNGSILAKAGLLPGVTSTPAAPGETVVLYGTGFGATDPSLPAGNIVTGGASLRGALSITIGGLPANVQFSGRTASGLDQFNVEIPGLMDGDHEVIATIDGVLSRTGVLISVKR